MGKGTHEDRTMEKSWVKAYFSDFLFTLGESEKDIFVHGEQQ